MPKRTLDVRTAVDLRPHEHALVAYELCPDWQPASCGLFFVKYLEGRIHLKLLFELGRSEQFCIVPAQHIARLVFTWNERSILNNDCITTYVDYDEWLDARFYITNKPVGEK